MLVVIAQKEELKLVEELGYGDYPIRGTRKFRHRYRSTH